MKQMRLIDADALKKEFPKDTDWEYPVNTHCHVCEIIDSQPTIEPERKTGKWIEHHEPYTWMGYTYWSCSNCGFECGYDKVIRFKTDFCPNCGADMRGEPE